MYFPGAYYHEEGYCEMAHNSFGYGTMLALGLSKGGRGMRKSTCKDCKWFEYKNPRCLEGWRSYGTCTWDGEDVGPNTPGCFWFEEVSCGQKKKDES